MKGALIGAIIGSNLGYLVSYLLRPKAILFDRTIDEWLFDAISGADPTAHSTLIACVTVGIVVCAAFGAGVEYVGHGRLRQLRQERRELIHQIIEAEAHQLFSVEDIVKDNDIEQFANKMNDVVLQNPKVKANLAAEEAHLPPPDNPSFLNWIIQGMLFLPTAIAGALLLGHQVRIGTQSFLQLAWPPYFDRVFLWSALLAILGGLLGALAVICHRFSESPTRVEMQATRMVVFTLIRLFVGLTGALVVAIPRTAAFVLIGLFGGGYVAGTEGPLMGFFMGMSLMMLVLIAVYEQLDRF